MDFKINQTSRYKLLNFSKKRKLNMCFLVIISMILMKLFLRKIQQSGTSGLSIIFSPNYENLKLHRPLKNTLRDN